MNSKKVFLQGEGDAYFERNVQKGGISKGTGFLAEFLNKNPDIFNDRVKNILEIGCGEGKNLIYLAENFKLKCFGIEPSEKAIKYGQDVIRSKGIADVELLQGTSDDLPYEENSMDFVILGFCMCWVDRRYLLKTAAEVDRILKRGGFLLIEDFDVPNPIQRTYKHNANVYTFKYNNADLFLGDPSYSLIEKKSYSHASDAFDPRIQERLSSCILYKEKLEDVYQFVNEG